MGVLFITHDLGVIAEIAQRVIIMYKGAIVEEGTTAKIFTAPDHPYTKSLLDINSFCKLNRPAEKSLPDREPYRKMLNI